MQGRVRHLAEKYKVGLAAAMAAGGAFPAAPGETPEARVSALSSGDPSGKGRHLEALVRWHCRGSLDKERLSSVREDLGLFDRGRGLLSVGERDPLSMDGPDQLAEAALRLRGLVDRSGALTGKEADRALSARMRRPPHARVLFDGPDGVLAEVLSAEGAAWWGRGTKWCTNGTGGAHARSYLRKGPLYVACLPDGTKFQWTCAAPAADPRNNEAGFEIVLAKMAGVAGHAGALAALLRRAPSLASSLLEDHPEAPKALSGAFGPEYALEKAGRLDRAALAAGIASHPESISRLPEELLDRGLCRMAVERYPSVFPSIPIRLVDPGMARAWMGAYGCDAAKLAEFMKTPELPWAAAAVLEDCRSSDLLELLDDASVAALLEEDGELAAAAVRREPGHWRRLSARRRSDPSVLAAAVGSDPLLSFDAAGISDLLASKGKRKEAEAVERAVREAVRTVLEECGTRISDVDPRFLGPEEAAIAVASSPRALALVPEEHLRDELFEAALRSDPAAAGWLDGARAERAAEIAASLGVDGILLLPSDPDRDEPARRAAPLDTSDEASLSWKGNLALCFGLAAAGAGLMALVSM